MILNNKLETLTNLFEGKEIRSIWDKDKEEYYFSVVDVIAALVSPKDPSDYWTTLKRRMLRLSAGIACPRGFALCSLARWGRRSLI